MPFGILLQKETGAGDRHMLPDGGDDIRERPVMRIVIERVIGGEQPDAGLSGNCGQNGKIMPVETVIMRRQSEIEPVARMLLQCPEQHFQALRFRPPFALHDDQKKLLLPFEQVGEMERAVALLRAQVTGAEQAAEMPPAPPVLRISENVRRAVGKTRRAPGWKG